MAFDRVPSLEEFVEGLEKRNPAQPEFIQAVKEVAENVLEYIRDHPKYNEHQILERITEPDRTISFRVCWHDDQGRVRVNRGYRVQNNNAIGPYKGGIRFHPTVNQSVLKFLAFEQTFKNALTGLPMGGAKGGADLDPKDKSDAEIMRFCQAFITELYRHLGEDTDIPAGDIGVGAREIGYMFGQYKRITNRYVGVLTGKGMEFGGSPIRVEATGYGAVYFMEDMLKRVNEAIDGRICVISGSGNVAQHVVEKVLALGGKPVTLSDSAGFIYDKSGITTEKLAYVKDLKNKRRGRIEEYAKEFGAEFHAGCRPWSVPGELAFPCATHNEINGDDAKMMLKNGIIAVAEGSNMPSTLDAVKLFQGARIKFAPGKAANAGGVAVSGLEMSQNSARITWKEPELQRLLRDIMQEIHDRCQHYGGVAGDKKYIDYVQGANVGGFVKVADAMIAQGLV